MLTIKDIAKQLGMSPSTVSRALNNHPKISEKTRKTVMDYVEKNHYTPNLNARNLVNRNSHVIGFMIPDISDSFFSRSAFGVEELLYQNGYDIAYSSTERSVKRVKAYLINCMEHRFSGAFVTPDEWTDDLVELIHNLNIPIVSLRRKTPRTSPEIPYVDSDHYGAIRTAMDYLFKLGHIDIGMISADTIIERERLNSYHDVMKEMGLKSCFVDGITTKVSANRIESGYKAAKIILERNPTLTAIVSSDDMMAIGIMEYLNKMGKSVPEDISVIGCDDRLEGRLYPIQLTTMQQSLHEMGNQAASMMLKLIQARNRQIPSVTLSTILVERKTAGQARTKA